MNAQVAVAMLVGVAAVVDDLARREIANWIPAAALAGGLGWQVGQYGWQGALYALGGAAAGFAAFLIFYLAGGMGGGDIKLMAGFGALLGAMRLAEAALWTAALGGLLAVAFVAFRFVGRMIRRREEETRPGHHSIPYAPAIALGVWISLISKG